MVFPIFILFYLLFIRIYALLEAKNHEKMTTTMTFFISKLANNEKMTTTMTFFISKLANNDN